MAKAIALTQRIAADPADIARALIVSAFALALICASQALPF